MTDSPPIAQPSSTARPPGQAWIVGSMVLVMFFALSFIGYRWFQNDTLAVLVELSGEAERDTADSEQEWQAAKSNDPFADGDGARTKEGATALFKLQNGAKLKLKPASQIRFKRSHTQSESGLGIDVAVGEAEIESGASGFTIDSEFGPILLDANSAVSMSREGASLVVGVDLGRIEIGDEKRAFQAGQSTELTLGGIILEPADSAPSAPPSASAVPEAAPAPELELGDGVTAFELSVSPGDSFVVHDPSPPSAVGFNVAKLCGPGGARLSAGRQKTEGTESAGLRLGTGRHAYEIRCLNSPAEVAAKGTIRVLKDAGTRPLPSFSPKANVTTDGRPYTILYQNKLPRVTVSWPSAPQTGSYTLTVGGRTIDTSVPSYTFNSLKRGRHQLVFAANSTPPRQSRTTTVEVVYDTQAPAARVSFRPTQDDSGKLRLSGQALPGWQVSVGGEALEVDGAQKFSTELDPGGALPIAFTHPARGTHYYLRNSEAPKP